MSALTNAEAYALHIAKDVPLTWTPDDGWQLHPTFAVEVAVAVQDTDRLLRLVKPPVALHDLDVPVAALVPSPALPLLSERQRVVNDLIEQGYSAEHAKRTARSWETK